MGRILVFSFAIGSDLQESICFSDERKIADLPEYCDAGIATYVDTLTKAAKVEVSITPTATDEDLGIPGGPIGDSEEVASIALWDALHKFLLLKFRKDDSEQHRVAVPFLCALVKDKAFCTDAEEVERYIYQYKVIPNTLLTDGCLPASIRWSYSCRGSRRAW